MNEKELIRRALLGDKQAQEDCTEKGIALPCPKCFSDDVRIEGDGYDIYHPDTLGYLDSVADSMLYITCDDCGLCSNAVVVDDEEEQEDAEKRLIADWNTRPAPPIGRCGECEHYNTKLHYCDILSQESDYRELHYVLMSPDDFCSHFEPKEEE